MHVHVNRKLQKDLPLGSHVKHRLPPDWHLCLSACGTRRGAISPADTSGRLEIRPQTCESGRVGLRAEPGPLLRPIRPLRSTAMTAQPSAPAEPPGRAPGSARGCPATSAENPLHTCTLQLMRVIALMHRARLAGGVGGAERGGWRFRNMACGLCTAGTSCIGESAWPEPSLGRVPS